MRKEKTRELNKYIAMAETQERQANTREFARFAGNGWFGVPFEDMIKIHDAIVKAISKKERSSYCIINNKTEIGTFINALFNGIITISPGGAGYTTININIDYSALSDTEYNDMVKTIRKKLK